MCEQLLDSDHCHGPVLVILAALLGTSILLVTLFVCGGSQANNLSRLDAAEEASDWLTLYSLLPIDPASSSNALWIACTVL